GFNSPTKIIYQSDMKPQPYSAKNYFTRFFVGCLALTALVAVSCNDNGVGPDEEPILLKVDTMRNMMADPVHTGGKFALYSIDEKTQIPNSDSATTRWDIAIRSTSIIFNSGVS